MDPARIKKLIAFSDELLKRLDKQAKLEGRNRKQTVRRANATWTQKT